MTIAQTIAPPDAPRRGRLWRRPQWLLLVPFFAFAVMFLLAPVLYLFVGAFQDASGALTFDNIRALASPIIADSYSLSIRLSLASAAVGTVCGLLLACALVFGDMPGWVRSVFTTFSGVASNFAGIPLAFAFIATLGPRGLITMYLRNNFGFNPYAAGFSLFSFWGLVITYLYFQMSLMILIISPALDGLRNEWSEAASSLGATRGQYWRLVALPILAPSVFGCFLLLFANAFGTLATIYALTGSRFNVVPITLFAQIRGNVLYNPNLGYALAVGMVVIAGVSSILYILLRNRAERWRS